MENIMITREFLISFEEEIAQLFNDGKIRSPVHLYHGNEWKIMQVFKKINKDRDWVCCTWRNHYQALLKGIPPEVLKEMILDGKSMTMNSMEHKFICSSIVGGIPSIATGIALALKLENEPGHVWCWVGDMSAETGSFHEAYKYSITNDLPITFIIENNEKSVCTPTEAVWKKTWTNFPKDGIDTGTKKIIKYSYKNDKYPHAGAGKRVQF